MKFKRIKVTIKPRHRDGCTQKGKANPRCDCPLYAWASNGKRKALAEGLSPELIEKRAEEFRQELLGIKPPEDVTLKNAIEDYQKTGMLYHKRGKVKEQSLAIPRRMLQRLQDYSDKNNIVLLKDVSTKVLEQFRTTWTLKEEDSSSRRMHEAPLRKFFNWVVKKRKAEYRIADNPYAPIDLYPDAESKTTPLEVAEVERLLAGTKTLDTAVDQIRMKGLIWLQRWTGLSLIDALTLTRTKLQYDKELKVWRIVLAERTKTAEEVVAVLPDDVAEFLLITPSDNAAYFFWDGTQDRQALRMRYTLLYEKVFDAAGIPRDRSKGGMTLSHRLRDTFAVQYLANGGDMTTLSKLLGHASIRTTENAYAKFDKSRQKAVLLNAKANLERQREAQRQQEEKKQEQRIQ